MLSIEKLFGKKDPFFDLLEASAGEARRSVQLLTEQLANPARLKSIEEFHAAKVAGKKTVLKIEAALQRNFITHLEREDIELLSAALYKIPKTVEKFCGLFQVCAPLVAGTSFARHMEFMDQAAQQLVKMVEMLRDVGRGRLDEAKELNQRLQQIEGAADTYALELLGDLYSGRHDPLRVLALRDLYDVLEKVIDRFRDAGNVITHVFLKSS